MVLNARWRVHYRKLITVNPPKRPTPILKDHRLDGSRGEIRKGLARSSPSSSPLSQRLLPIEVEPDRANARLCGVHKNVPTQDGLPRTSFRAIDQKQTATCSVSISRQT